MWSVKWTAYGCFGFAGLSVIMAMSMENPGFLPAGIGLLVLGVAFLAADRALGLLVDIKQALTQASSTSPSGTQLVEAELVAAVESKPARTAAEISADLQRLKARS